ncbi:TRAP transporter small permease [Dolosicoccus paucivorans]|uniref:TRAP transporter small permease n=1 Tax=Dolosicoccus paucivorans TaxID=84521 RepID=A0A2N6SLE4_9LACT|nr:TRAP transporter small permease [Dolosicoccus paucivorans]PMC57907.1 TRAP transporter small permease [Dolosicoccus paucivorans]
MIKVREYLDSFLKLANAIMLAFLTSLTVWQVVTRYLLNNPSTWSEELASYMFTWVTMLGATYIFGKRGHMNIPIVMEKLSPRNQKYAVIFNDLLVLIFAITVLIMGGFSITKLTMGQMSSSLSVPMGYFYAILPVTGVLTALYSLLNLYDAFQDLKKSEL